MKKSLTIKQQKQVAALPPDTPAYRIAVTQLDKLETIAKERLFTADEARLYDILCKSLVLVKEAPTTSDMTLKKEVEVNEKDLIDIARNDVDFKDLIKEDLKLVKEDSTNGKETS